MSDLGTFQQKESIPKLTQNMRRFNLKSRKSSYSSSSRDGSSATNESTSNSSQPSLPDVERRSSRTSFISLSSRLKRPKASRIEEEEAYPSTVRKQQHASRSIHTLGDRFFDLPAEIQTSILSYLSISELLTLRQTSKQCLAIFRANAATITRNALLAPIENGSDATYTMSFIIDLYPSTFSSTTSDAYFLRTIHRTALIKRQLNVLLTFIQFRVYMLKINLQLEGRHFAPYRCSLYTRLYSCTGYIQHLLESIRHLVIHIHPTHSSPSSAATINHCTSCTRRLKSVIKSYPAESLVNIHQLITILLQHLRAATRSPSNISGFERKLRGWSYGPPPAEHLSQLIILGGVAEISKLDEMQGSYSKRLAIVKSFSDTIAETVRINSIAFPDFYQTDHDPVMGISAASGASAGAGKKHKQAIPKQINRDKYGDIRTALDAHIDGLDIPIQKSLQPRLDLLTGQIVESVPHNIETLLSGPESVLVKLILELKLVESEKELSAPYAWLQRFMIESYKPDNDENGPSRVTTNNDDDDDEDGEEDVEEAIEEDDEIANTPNENGTHQVQYSNSAGFSYRSGGSYFLGAPQL